MKSTFLENVIIIFCVNFYSVEFFILVGKCQLCNFLYYILGIFYINPVYPLGMILCFGAVLCNHPEVRGMSTKFSIRGAMYVKT